MNTEEGTISTTSNNPKDKMEEMKTKALMSLKLLNKKHEREAEGNNQENTLENKKVALEDNVLKDDVPGHLNKEENSTMVSNVTEHPTDVEPKVNAGESHMMTETENEHKESKPNEENQNTSQPMQPTEEVEANSTQEATKTIISNEDGTNENSDPHHPTQESKQPDSNPEQSIPQPRDDPQVTGSNASNPEHPGNPDPNHTTNPQNIQDPTPVNPLPIQPTPTKKTISLAEAKKEIDEFATQIEKYEAEIKEKYGIKITEFYYEDILPEELKIKLVEEFFNSREIVELANKKV